MFIVSFFYENMRIGKWTTRVKHGKPWNFKGPDDGILVDYYMKALILVEKF